MAPEEIKLLASDGGAGDAFGVAVALDNDTAVIGAPYSRRSSDYVYPRGSAYIFTRSHSGEWSETAKLLGSDAWESREFGWSVAIEDDTVVIGTHGGTAYVFIRDHSGTWTEQARLSASVDDDHNFGSSVAIAGDTVLVGAPPLPFEAVSGAAYVFVRDGVTWTEQARLVPPGDPVATRFVGFGSSVAISGKTAIIGSQFDQIGSQFDQKTISYGTTTYYVFVRDPSGVWMEGGRLVAHNDSEGNGTSAALSGNTALIGIDSDKYIGRPFSGSVRVFRRDWSGSWAEHHKLLPRKRSAHQQFGHSVALSGNYALIGADAETVDGIRSGAAYLFSRNRSGLWRQTIGLLAHDRAESDFFGASVALSGSTALIGASGRGDLGSDSGAAYIFSFEHHRPPRADLSISMVDHPDPLTAGTELVYTLDIQNAGPDSVESVSLIDRLPAGTRFVSASQGCHERNGMVSCKVGRIMQGSDVVLNIAVVPTNPGIIINRARVHSNSIDPNPRNNRASETTRVRPPERAPKEE